MKAYLSITRPDGRIEELALRGPLAAALVPVIDHLAERHRATYDHISRIDRERARGKHELAFADLLQLVAAAHALLVAPPIEMRRARHLPDGPHPHTERVQLVLAWLSERRDAACVHYDLWSGMGTV